jgi:hypothetical protein
MFLLQVPSYCVLQIPAAASIPEAARKVTKEVANLGFGSLAADHPHCAALVRHTNDFGILPLLYLQYVIIWNTVKGLLSPLHKTDRPGHDPATRTDT